MINANELRMGNWINNRKLYGGREMFYDKVNDILLKPRVKTSPANEEDDPRINDNSYKNIEPIPLSYSILEKCGFEKGVLKFRLGVNDLCLSAVNMGQEVELKDNHNSSYHHYKSLHQIQNLYFALTGRELEVKL